RASSLQRPLEGFANVRFEPIADLDVVVPGQLDAALQARLHFLHVLLYAAKRFDREVFGDDAPVADETDLASALDVPVGNVAPGNVADARDLEHLPDLDMPVELLANLRLEHAAERLLNV